VVGPHSAFLLFVRLSFPHFLICSLHHCGANAPRHSHYSIAIQWRPRFVPERASSCSSPLVFCLSILSRGLRPGCCPGDKERSIPTHPFDSITQSAVEGRIRRRPGLITLPTGHTAYVASQLAAPSSPVSLSLPVFVSMRLSACPAPQPAILIRGPHTRRSLTQLAPGISMSDRSHSTPPVSACVTCVTPYVEAPRRRAQVIIASPHCASSPGFFQGSCYLKTRRCD